MIFIFLTVVAAFAFVAYSENQSKKMEIKRLREVIIALKTKTIDEYVQAVPDDTENLPAENKDELVELDQVEPEVLLKHLRE